MELVGLVTVDVLAWILSGEQKTTGATCLCYPTLISHEAHWFHEGLPSLVHGRPVLLWHAYVPWLSLLRVLSG